MKKWINKWDDLFDSSNPNAALNYETEDGSHSTYVFEIHKPSYNKKSGRLSFNATQHKDQVINDLILGSDLTDTDHALKHSDPVIGEFKRSSLFVDTAGDSPQMQKAKDGNMYEVLGSAKQQGQTNYVLPANAPNQSVYIHPNDGWSSPEGSGQVMTPRQGDINDFRGTSPNGDAITAYLTTGVYNAEWTKYEGDKEISCTQNNDITGCSIRQNEWSFYGWPRKDVNVQGFYGAMEPAFGIWSSDGDAEAQPLMVNFSTMGQMII